MKRSKEYFFLFFLLISLFLAGQNNSKQFNVWCFGNNAGVDFNSGSPIAFAGSAIVTAEGCASICNTSGQLLFYTDGQKVWDRSHAVMSNADGSVWAKRLSGSKSSAQSALITVHPCDSNKYYIFTTDGGSLLGNVGDDIGPKGAWDGLYYTVINMTLNGGMGDVDISFLSTLPGYVAGENKIALIDTVQEKLSAAIHSNETNYWVVAQRVNGDFYSFLVDCDGVNINPVKSTNLYNSDVTCADMAFSKDGKCLVVAGGAVGTTDMFDFNTATGIVSNKREMVLDHSEIAPWGVCFSPDDSIIYLMPWFGTEYKRYKRFANDIMASGILGAIPTSASVMQLGPDGKIYTASALNGSSLSAFTTPNNFSDPGFVSNVVTLSAGTTCSNGLPNTFVGMSLIKRKKFVRTDTSFCFVDQQALAIGQAAVDCFDYLWTPLTGLDNHTSGNPLARPYQTTTYKVLATSSCTTYVDSVTITVENCGESVAFFPNAFTPNNDGVNDVFIPVLNGYRDIEYGLQIFDRWGNLIFTTNDYKQGWNGCVGNSMKTAQQDVYVYKIFAIDNYGIKLEKVGHLSLVK